MKSMSSALIAVILAGCAPASFEAPQGERSFDQQFRQLGLSSPFLRQSEPFTLVATGAPAGSTVYFGAGHRTGAGPTVAPGVTLGLRNPVVLGSAVADGSGVATLEAVAPDSLGIGSTVYLQAATSAGNRRPSPVVGVTVSEDIEAFGNWEVAGLGFTVEVDNTEIRSDLIGDHAIVRHDNVRRAVVAFSGAGTRVPGAYTRMDWTFVGGSLFGCVAVDDAPTAASAANGAASDPTDLAGGCPTTSAWLSLTPTEPVLEGSWTDNFGTGHEISADAWLQLSPFGDGSWTLTHWSDLDGWMVGQNDPSNLFFPGDWSRYDHTVDAAGTRYYCQTAFAAASEYEARTTPPADASDLASGCGGFSWSELTPVP